MDRVVVQYAHSIIGRFPFFDGIAVFFAAYLPYAFVAAFVFCLYSKSAFGESAGLVRARLRLRFILMAFFALLLALGIIVPLIHYSYGRIRPFVEFDWTPLFAHEVDPSFPSRHATFMFTLAASIWQLKRKWGYWFCAAALVSGFARVYALVHYPTDIMAGAIIGIAVVFLARQIARM